MDWATAEPRRFMQITGVPTEQTTAATDALLALVGLLGAAQLRGWRKVDRSKADVWTAMFASMALAAVLGMVVHGFEFEPAPRASLWKVLNASLGFTVTFFAIGAAREIILRRATRRILVFMIAIGALLFTWMLVTSGKFALFILYESGAMLFALGVYSIRLVRGHSAGTGWMFVGVVLTIIAAGFQSLHSVVLMLIWPFNHNGLFHLIQILALFCLLRGLNSGFRHSPRDSSFFKSYLR